MLSGKPIEIERISYTSLDGLVDITYMIIKENVVWVSLLQRRFCKDQANLNIQQ